MRSRSLLVPIPFSLLALLAMPIFGMPAQAPSPASSVASDPVTAPARAPSTYANAIVISVDGLRSDALIAVPAEQLPAFHRLRANASTLNARTDPDWTVTLPNHTAMITGRFVEGPDGHAWTKNDDADPGETLSSNKKAYVAGIFDVAHDNGFATGLFAGKSKFSVYDETWNAQNGAADVTGGDDGKDKLDQFVFEPDTVKMTDAVLAALTRADDKRKLLFVHFAITDLTAHAYGWDVTPGSKYMKAVAAVDAQLGRILDAIEGSDRLRGKTAIVLTADHGGGAPFKSHDRVNMWVDYIIPLVVWTGSSEGPLDLYALHVATRADPGLTQPSRKFTGKPPIRNGDAGNLALELLGLPAVPGSTIGAKQDLVVTGPAH
jgi:predicted AlkP superfamily pyrophosphatase or phosphodiesterase